MFTISVRLYFQREGARERERESEIKIITPRKNKNKKALSVKTLSSEYLVCFPATKLFFRALPLRLPLPHLVSNLCLSPYISSSCSWEKKKLKIIKKRNKRQPRQQSKDLDWKKNDCSLKILLQLPAHFWFVRHTICIAVRFVKLSVWREKKYSLSYPRRRFSMKFFQLCSSLRPNEEVTNFALT